MKVPTFIRKITAKVNCRRSKSDSSDIVVEAVGLHRESEKEELNSEHLPVEEEVSASIVTKAVPPVCAPSIDKFLLEDPPVDDDISLSSTLDQHFETEDVHSAIPQRQSSRRPSDDRSGDSLSISMLLNDDMSEVCGDDVNNFTKVETLRSRSSRSLVPKRGLPRKNSIGSLSMSMASLHGMRNTSGQCPFKHGTVYSGPYPGYAHGNPKRGICPNGCRAEMNSDITGDESTAETMMREAMEYLDLYYHERSEEMSGTKGFLPKKERMAEVRKAIHETGTYVHTFDELEHGARVAWRNAPKCSNRKYWQQLKLLDCRDVDTNEGMYGSCIKHLTKAVACGSAEAYVTVFRPTNPGTGDGPAIWNEQLLSYAAYNQDGKVIGDPKNLRFTQMLEERFGWKGPPDGKQGPYDYLPLVIQSSPNDAPQLFDVPLECAPEVHIHHPEHPELSELNMRWYPIPAVCALDMTIGGIVYSAVPFNGWYANTEVLRDLTDASRYNMLVPVARALGLDPDTKPGDEPLWKDEVMAVLNKAIYHSFKVSKVAIVGHHNLIAMFWDWYNDEMRHRKYCPVNWKWVIPPMSSSTNEAYLGLNKALEYTLKPAYVGGKNFLTLEREHFGKRDTTKSMRMFFTAVFLASFFKNWVNRVRQKRQPILILYASVTGNAAAYASKLGSVLRACSQVTFFDCCGTNSADDLQIMTLVKSSTLCIFITSTQGNGELPSLSRKFFSTLFGKKGHVLLDKNCAVLGFGSSAYPIFCGAAAELSRKIVENGGWEIVPSGLCDAVKGEDITFQIWTATLLDKLASMPDASPLVVKLSERINDIDRTDTRRQIILESVAVQIFSSKEVKEAAAKSFMSRRSSSVARQRAIASRRTLTERRSDSRRSSVDSSTVHSLDSSHHLDSSLHCVFEGVERIDEAIMKALQSTSRLRKDIFQGQILSRMDLLGGKESENETDLGDDNESTKSVRRKTSLIKIGLDLCGNPPYQPGDHVQVYPHNTISEEKLGAFVGNLAGKLNLDDEMFVTFENHEVSLAELAVTAPILYHNIDQLVSLDSFFKTQASMEAPIPTQSCLDLASLATSTKDNAMLKELGTNKAEYDKMISLCGMKWMDAFDMFPSLSGQVTLSFLLSSMKMNHPRSYSIASCKTCVGPEIDLVVGSFIFSRGGSKIEVGVCSNFLTNVNFGDEITFKIESNPSFHYPLDPIAPLIFICTGTGFAPIRGLLQKRSHFRSRGEKMGTAYLVFGSRSKKEGLFEDEIENFINEGTLTDAFKCYSREPGMKKQYTTDIMKNEKIEQVLAPIVESDDSHVYICGSAHMFEMCKSVMIEMTSKFCVNKLIEEGRLHSDVFGALNPAGSVVSRSRSASINEGLNNLSSRRKLVRNRNIESYRHSMTSSDVDISQFKRLQIPAKLPTV
ncbi:nitric oxide synthase [Skeletonema marinoi]|uniref:nitric-oxide synthase (NADPH) n=1 Tax=Skeletonema marinoi TaxID=267567 RepID=A0AAD8Y0N5_9STRA|nr:nitric oxide synthase [Skeletonema marinoi]